MTECPKCKGYGIIGDAVPDILRGRGHIFSSNECDMCHGSGEVPMTNEEWFNGLSTEEKAEFLIASIKKCKSCASGISVDEVQHCPFGECGCHFKDEVVKWLKQPHTIKE